MSDRIYVGPRIWFNRVHQTFIIPVKFPILRNDGKEIQYVFSALIDSTSPVNLIKGSLTPLECFTPVSSTKYSFQDLNDSPLRIKGVFDKEVDVDVIKVRIKFLIVLDDTMTHAAILGRDFFYTTLNKSNNGSSIYYWKSCLGKYREREIWKPNSTDRICRNIHCIVNTTIVSRKLDINLNLAEKSSYHMVIRKN